MPPSPPSRPPPSRSPPSPPLRSPPSPPSRSPPSPPSRSPPSPRQSFVPQMPSLPLPEPEPEPEPEPLASEAGNVSDYPVKKQKLDEEYAGSSAYGSFSQRYADRDCWIKFFKDIRESEGFDFKEHPGTASGPAGMLVPMPHYVTNPVNLERMKDYAAQALEQYNKENNTEYEVNEILKVNGQVISSFMFFITLSVKNGDNEYFQVKVVQRRNGFLDFPIVRPRVKGGLDIQQM